MPHYRHAPITEAVVELRTRLPEAVTVDMLRGVGAWAGIDFANAHEIKQTQFALRISEGQPESAASAQPLGWAFQRADEKQLAQARLDAFAFSQLAPYDRWETFRAQALSWWRVYREIAKPEAITRIGLRFINRFDLPVPFRDLKDFFRTTPEVSPEMPQMLSAFFMQLQIPYPDQQALLILNQAAVPPPRVGVTSVVLDIDVSRSNNLPRLDDEIWQLLDQLRTMKNEVFEACVTDPARELIR